jgi:predicted adenine nucleotide alpha hydrolase (AANH) superfamily ATPase
MRTATGTTGSNGPGAWRTSPSAACVRAAAKYPGLMQSEYNWRKGGGSARMTEISKRESFHQRAYCGCVYSLRDANRHRVEGGRERMQLGVKFYGDEEPATD